MFIMGLACVVQKRKDLTGMDGHLILLEYMEESPLLVGYPGKMHRIHLSSPFWSITSVEGGFSANAAIFYYLHTYWRNLLNKHCILLDEELHLFVPS